MSDEENDLESSEVARGPKGEVISQWGTVVKPRSAWERLIVKHCPKDKRICNCQQAYATLHRERRPAGGTCWSCAHGCSAAQIRAQRIVAEAIEKEA